MVRSPSDAPSGLPATFGELRDSGWRPRTVKEELRANFVARLAAGREIFPGIVGYGDTVIPAIENAILAGQDIVFLGERGQGKTRLARLLVSLLDEWLPVVRGGELNDDPFAPISAAALASSGGSRKPRPGPRPGPRPRPRRPPTRICAASCVTSRRNASTASMPFRRASASGYGHSRTTTSSSPGRAHSSMRSWTGCARASLTG